MNTILQIAVGAHVDGLRDGAYPLALRFVALLVALTVLAPQSAIAVPPLVGPVSDHANLLTADEEARIASFLLGQERHTSNQIAVLTVDSLDGLSDVEFAQEVFENWRLGQADRDNGVLLLIATNPRQVRIHTGYGVEGALPDGLCGAIIREEITPRLKSGDFFGAVDQGTRAIERAIHDEYTRSPEAREGLPLLVGVVFAALFAVLVWVILRSLSWIGLPICGVVIWAIATSGLELEVQHAVLVTSTLLALMAWMLYRYPPFPFRALLKRRLPSDSSSTEENWSSSVDGGGGSSSSSSGDSKWSGEGGESGGGGASDKW